MKEIERFFSLRDFFNYYIAGIIWIVNFVFVLIIIASVPSGPQFFEAMDDILQVELGTLPSLVVGTLVVILPYTVGFASTPFCEEISGKAYKDDDPVTWVTGGGKDHEKQKLPEGAIGRISKLGMEKFGYEIKDIHLWFYQIRAYVLDQGGEAANLSLRAYNLMNFTESLLIPMPLFFAILPAITIHLLLLLKIDNLFAALFPLLLLRRVPGGAAIVFADGLSVFLGYFFIYKGIQHRLTKRYLKFREYYVKHTYRAFLVLKANEKH